MKTQAPIPGTAAQPVNYPACEWVDANGTADQLHALNRFVCSWLTSDMNEPERCDEVLQAMAQIEAATRHEWFVDGDAFLVDMRVTGVQFNPSHVGPEDAAYWNRSEAHFPLIEVKTLLCVWRDHLTASV